MNANTPISKAIFTTKNHLKRLETLGIKTVKDFLLYFPRIHTDQSNLIKIIDIKTDEVNSYKGMLSQLIHLKSKFGKIMTKAKFSDDSGSIEVIWFNQPYLQRILKNGQQIILSGKATFKLGKISLQNPEFEEVSDEQLHVGRIVPIYHETLGISSKWIRNKLHPLLKYTQALFPEYLPEHIIKEYNFISYAKAITEIHFPTNSETFQKAKERLSFDELFLLQLKALQKKWQWQKIAEHEKKALKPYLNLEIFIQGLPFELTFAQKKSLQEILKDLNQEFPMSRLLQGDVGSGKTIVAGLAILSAVKNNFQVALMAPTEILAEQHYQTLLKLFIEEGINLKFIAGSTKKSEKTEIALQLKAGLIDVIIGTHAIIQENIGFKNLGLAIIDEQHRFGVKQRDILKSQGSPHLLSLSATPIPRTLAMTIYGDQDLSIIDEMPKGRQTIITRIVPENKRIDAYRWIEDRVKTGRQAFVICPLIDESDVLEVKSATQEYEYLKNEIFPDLTVGLLHGKMKAKDKEEIMQKFKKNEINILVSTSVIEVGIDIPNATIMMIEGAERFGLSQLHQFRGRVGRGEYQSYCFLFMQNYSENAKKRLNAMVTHSSGFKLSEIDLELRGPGHIYGVKQSGIPDLKMASLTDSIGISKARKVAQELINLDPELKNYPKLQEKLQELEEVYIND